MEQSRTKTRRKILDNSGVKFHQIPINGSMKSIFRSTRYVTATHAARPSVRITIAGDLRAPRNCCTWELDGTKKCATEHFIYLNCIMSCEEC